MDVFGKFSPPRRISFHGECRREILRRAMADFSAAVEGAREARRGGDEGAITAALAGADSAAMAMDKAVVVWRAAGGGSQ